MKKITFSFPLACLLLFNGCATNNAFMDNIGKIGGTTAGAGVGAVVGKQLGGRGGLIAGALIGGTKFPYDRTGIVRFISQCWK